MGCRSLPYFTCSYFDDAQRLVNEICPGTGKPMPIEGSLKAMIDKQFADLPARI